MSSPTCRARTRTTTSGSPPRPPPASRSRGGCGSPPRTGTQRLGVSTNQLSSRSRSPANTPRSSTSCAMATSTAASCCGARAAIDDRAGDQQHQPQLNFANGGFFPAPGGNPVNLERATGELAGDQRPFGSPGADRNLCRRQSAIILNSLGDLTNRENRSLLPAVLQRLPEPSPAHCTAGWPGRRPQRRQRARLLPDALSHRFPPLVAVRAPVNDAAIQLIYEPTPAARHRPGLMAFPFVFPGCVFASPRP